MGMVALDVNGHRLDVRLEDNSSAQAFAVLLADGPITVSMDDYANMEKVGLLPQSLPRNDAQTSVGPGDVILYQGNQITVYYDTNAWNFTKLGHVQGMDEAELRDALGAGSVEATFSLLER